MASLSPPNAPYQSQYISPLKNITLVEAYGYTPNHQGNLVIGEQPWDNTAYEFQKDSTADSVLKHRIRILKVLSRLITVLLSIASFIPVSLTLYKFLTTKDDFRDVKGPDGQTINRGPWATDTKAWPTYMFTAVSGVSVILNTAVLIAYLRSVRHANKAAKVAKSFDSIVLLGNLGVWITATVLYRQQKDLNGKSNDIWGWSCSPKAQQIQKDFAEVDFHGYCTIQTVSWEFSLVQDVAHIISIVTYILALRRLRLKKRIRSSPSPRSYERLGNTLS